MKQIIDNIKDKKQNIYFYLPETEQYMVSIYEMYLHATILKNNGYNVFFFSEDDQYKKPSWFEHELLDIQHIISNKDTSLKIHPEDFIVIPELFKNILEQFKESVTKNAKVIVWVQSIESFMRGLLPSLTYQDYYQIDTLIVNSEYTKLFIENNFVNEKFDIHTITPSIPEYFYQKDTYKKPKILFLTRNPNDITKVSNIFYNRYPNFSWIGFDHAHNTTRQDLAKKIQESAVCVWMDKLASFGTFNLECYASNTLCISYTPEYDNEVLLDLEKENSPLMNLYSNRLVSSMKIENNFYDIPELILMGISCFLEDTYPKDIFSEMEKVSNKYKLDDNKRKSILETYENIFEARVKEIENLMNVKNINE